MPFNRPVVAVRTSLKITFDTIQSNKNKQFKVPVQLLDELKGMCTRIKDRRKQGFVINKKNVSTAADCLYLDMPTGWKLSEEDSEVPSWNVYPEEDELPRKLMVLARQILDDRGCIIIQHPGTLRSTQQIADALDACSEFFKQVTEFYVHNEEVYHSKVEVFCKATTEFTFPKLDIDPFDPENSGRDCAMIVNFNGQGISKLNDKGRSKCIGFVQTLLENFTTQGDIVIDFAGGWRASLFATMNCSRCCIAAETRKEAFESLQKNIKEIEAATAGKKDAVAETGTSTAGKKSRGKKPLTEDDDLGDLLEDETLSAGDSTKRRKGRRNVNISSGQSPWYTPEKDYRLPVYAEDVAAKLAELPQTPSQTSVQSDNESSERMVFIDDEANVDAGSESSSAVTVYLSSDEELFKDD
ncbi:hypothetical protein R1sor_018753 [Riccia sorocarpa]|uniref:Uncharacterized protein n=1 Tax=Riccia sorocarpa TaxID=122646 RepID=A0ABD3IB46_9MARC